jgi:predicted HicB family RNase H-like nuclease
MKNLMKYKSYLGSVEYSPEDDVLFGKVQGIRSLINYEGNSIQELKQAFYESVDEYLADCEEEGKKPEIPYKGTFNVRIGQELHQKTAIYAEQHSLNLNSVVKEALEKFIA